MFKAPDNLYCRYPTRYMGAEFMLMNLEFERQRRNATIEDGFASTVVATSKLEFYITHKGGFLGMNFGSQLLRTGGRMLDSNILGGSRRR